MQKIIGYSRISDLKQIEGVSLEAQDNKIRSYGDLNDLEVEAIYTDEAITGRKENREGLENALKHACRIKGILVFYSLSRLARNTTLTFKIANVLENNGADMVSLSEKIDTTTACGKMIFRMLAVLAEFESDQIGERTKNSLAYLKSKGKVYCKNSPYGKMKDKSGMLVNNEEEQKIVKLIKRLRGGGRKYREIEEELRKRGLKNRKGKDYKISLIQHILKVA